jgi:hypothetical protein
MRWRRTRSNTSGLRSERRRRGGRGGATRGTMMQGLAGQGVQGLGAEEESGGNGVEGPCLHGRSYWYAEEGCLWKWAG